MTYKGVKGIDYTILYYSVAPRMTYLVRKAAVEAGLLSSAAYLRKITAEAVARDLGIDFDELMENMPHDTKDKGKGFGYRRGQESFVPTSEQDTD